MRPWVAHEAGGESEAGRPLRDGSKVKRRGTRFPYTGGDGVVNTHPRQHVGMVLGEQGAPGAWGLLLGWRLSPAGSGKGRRSEVSEVCWLRCEKTTGRLRERKG